MNRLPADASEVEAGLLGATTRPVSGLLLSISCRAAVARRPCWPDRRDPAWFEIRVASASSPSLSERTTTTCALDFSFLTIPEPELSQRASRKLYSHHAARARRGADAPIFHSAPALAAVAFAAPGASLRAPRAVCCSSSCRMCSSVRGLDGGGNPSMVRWPWTIAISSAMMGRSLYRSGNSRATVGTTQRCSGACGEHSRHHSGAPST